jgi:Helix-turn-helix domain
MVDSSYEPPDGYLTMAQAQAALGVSKTTLQKRVRAGLLSTYRDARDTRVRLVKVEDVARLREPVPESDLPKKAA